MSDLTPLVGEPLALDLVNTRPTTGDLLATPDDLRAWLDLQSDRFPRAREFAATEPTTDDLVAVRDVRDHTSQVLDHVRRGARPPAAAVEALNRVQRAAPSFTELAWDNGTVTASRRSTGSSTARLAAWLGEAAAELLVDPAVVRVRQCEADDCVLLFLPVHPRRRWCSAARCGNRVRVARHYQRHKPT